MLDYGEKFISKMKDGEQWTGTADEALGKL
jgi:hypothetical protein